MFAALGSSRCTVSEHSSTDSSTATAAGAPRRKSCSRAMPAAPARQPNPYSGTRLTSGRSPIRAGDPRVDRRDRDAGHRGEHDQVDVGRREAGLGERAGDAPALPRSTATGDERVVGGGEIVSSA